MTAKEACRLVTARMSNMRVVSCYEYNSIFVFQMAPQMTKHPARVLTGLTSVDKKTGLIRAFRPTDMPVREYRRGVRIPAEVYGGA